MRLAYDVAAVRAAEAAVMAGLPAGELMGRAAAGLAATSLRLLGGAYGRHVVVLAGSGDNGGDALYAGALLAARGARVEVLLTGSRAHEAGLAALRRAGGRVSESADRLDRADLVVDGMLGIGGSGGLRPPAARLAERARRGTGLVVAVDLPSGVDASTGAVEGAAVRADVTVTFGAYKTGLLVDPGAAYAGRVELVDIGLEGVLGAADVEAMQASDVAGVLPLPSAESDKYRRGVLGVVAGSPAYTGAAVLATGAAVRAGAGMVRYVGPVQPATLVRAAWPEVVVTEVEPGDPEAVLAAGRVQAWLAGPGMGIDEPAGRVLDALLGTDLPLLVDADGLTLLGSETRRAALGTRDAPTLLTPHAGELARLLGAERAAVEAHRLAYARRAAAELRATVLLKGSTTVVAEPEGRTRVNATGTSWLATAGTGDVLAGLCAALLAGGLDPLDGGSAGAYVHGLAARLAADGAAPVGGPVSAGDVLTAVPAAIRALCSANG